MNKRLITLLLAGSMVTGLAACDDDTGLMSPDGEGPSSELSIMVDEEITEAIVTEAEASLNAVTAAPGVSAGPSLFGEADESRVEEARELLRQAREKFAQAREAWARGDTELAAELALEGRLLVAEARFIVFGDEAFDDLLQRVEHLITWLEEGVDGDPSELLSRIRELRDEGVSLWDMAETDEDRIAAIERLILALHIGHRERTDRRHDRIDRHARLSIFMAGSAIDLATEIAGDDVTDRQAHLLRHAQQLVSEAERAYHAGRFRLAFSLAREAVSVALVVVVYEPDLPDNKVRALIEISDEAIAAAEEALNVPDPDPFAVELLERAQRLQARGIEIAERRPRRAISILWKAATMANGVVELVSDAQ